MRRYVQFPLRRLAYARPRTKGASPPTARTPTECEGRHCEGSPAGGGKFFFDSGKLFVSGSRYLFFLLTALVPTPRVRGSPPASGRARTARARTCEESQKAAVGFEPASPLPPVRPLPHSANGAAVTTRIRCSRLSDLAWEFSYLACPRVRGFPPWGLRSRSSADVGVAQMRAVPF